NDLTSSIERLLNNDSKNKIENIDYSNHYNQIENAKDTDFEDLNYANYNEIKDLNYNNANYNKIEDLNYDNADYNKIEDISYNETEDANYSDLEGINYFNLKDTSYKNFKDTNYNNIKDIDLIDTNHIEINEIYSIMESLRVNEIQHIVFPIEYPPISSEDIVICYNIENWESYDAEFENMQYMTGKPMGSGEKLIWCPYLN
ncbi:5797_t:CDS:2, partial [Scutellospora calospora]